MRRLFLGLFFGIFACVPVSAAQLKVVATTTYFADLARQVGGDRVEVSSVASPKFNVHFIQPRPSDVRRTARADLFLHAGLDLEAWADPLLEAAGKPVLMRGGERNLDLSPGVALLKIPEHQGTRAEGDLHLFGNPHYQMDPRNAKIVAASIARKLSEIDPEGAAAYTERERTFQEKLDAKIAEWKALCAHCTGKEIISFHDDIAYFADFLVLTADRFLEPKPGVPPTPRHLATLETYAKEKGIRAVVMPSYYEHASADAFAHRLGAKVVLIGQDPGELPESNDVFTFHEVNIRAIAEALR